MVPLKYCQVWDMANHILSLPFLAQIRNGEITQHQQNRIPEVMLPFLLLFMMPSDGAAHYSPQKS